MGVCSAARADLYEEAAARGEERSEINGGKLVEEVVVNARPMACSCACT